MVMSSKWLSLKLKMGTWCWIYKYENMKLETGVKVFIEKDEWQLLPLQAEGTLITLQPVRFIHDVLDT